nr:formin-like protein 7 [Aegilops tauschii subsp. strangulata]
MECNRASITNRLSVHFPFPPSSSSCRLLPLGHRPNKRVATDPPPPRRPPSILPGFGRRPPLYGPNRPVATPPHPDPVGPPRFVALCPDPDKPPRLRLDPSSILSPRSRLRPPPRPCPDTASIAPSLPRLGRRPDRSPPSEYFWKRDAEEKKKEVKKKDEAGPSTGIPIDSSEEDWVESEEGNEGCDDPDTDEFWAQFRSSDDDDQ